MEDPVEEIIPAPDRHKGMTGTSEENDGDIPDGKQIVLGEEVPDIYSVEAMREAYRQLYPNGGAQYGPDAIRTTHRYVRFLPKSEEEYRSIEHYDLSDIPLDRLTMTLRFRKTDIRGSMRLCRSGSWIRR